MVRYHHNKKKPVLETAWAVVPDLTVRCAGISDNRHAWQSLVIEQVVSGGALPGGLDCTTAANMLRCALTSHATYPMFVGDLSQGPARKGACLTEQHPTSLSRTTLGGR